MCSQAGKIQVTAFQSQGGQQHNVTPLAIAPPVIDLESSWSSSDNALAIEGIEQDTGDSRFSKSNKVWLYTTFLQNLFLYNSLRPAPF
jgi:BRCA1/BRCA2-containing complex subunit 3